MNENWFISIRSGLEKIDVEYSIVFQTSDGAHSSTMAIIKLYNHIYRNTNKAKMVLNSFHQP